MGNDQTYIVLLWGKCNETPRNASDYHKVFAFAPPYILCSLCFPWHLPPTDKLVDQLLPPTPTSTPPTPPCSRLSSKASICILNAAMASISAAVTVFGRQAGNIRWCDTDKIYLAADATSLPVSPCTRERKGVTERRKQPVRDSDE